MTSDAVSTAVRMAAYERDGGCCRVCGRHCGDTPGLHHIVYRSQGGSNDLDNLVTIGWVPGHDCHLSVVHANKRLWMPVLQTVIAMDGWVTAMQVVRWSRSSQDAGRGLVPVPEDGSAPGR